VEEDQRAPAYDKFWSEQALDKTMAEQPLKVPTMWIQGLWDQEDMWGAVHAYPALESKDTATTRTTWCWAPGGTAR
jgi:predicted acyl esterase